eukprot:jgi/Bigna1/129857/aug1.10_g4565
MLAITASKCSRRAAQKLPVGTSFQLKRFSSSSSVINVDNPYTSEIHCSISTVDQKIVYPVVALVFLTGELMCLKIQEEWAKTSLDHRRIKLTGEAKFLRYHNIILCIDVVQKFMENFKQRKEEIAQDISSMMGKPLAQAQGEVNGVMERVEAMCDFAPKALADEVLPKEGFMRKIVREPVGVVLVLAPWNYPLLTTVNSVIPAVLAGNSVVLKHSPRTPLCANHFQSAFESSGAPVGLVQALHTDNDTVHAAIQHPKIGFVSFTGSVATGHKIYESVARNRFIDTTLELGGKDGAYVAPDANLDNAVAGLVDGAFYNAGQSCCGIERVYVHESMYDEFVEKAAETISGYVLGDPSDEKTTLGPLALSSQPAFLEAQVNDARAKGARVVVGGKPTTDSAGKGRFFEPTLVADVTSDMDIATVESFGPVLAVASVKSDDDAVERLNSTNYGLTGVLFTESAERAMQLAPRIEAGTVFMNRCDYLDPMLPWTGVKDTGKGVSLSEHGFGAFSRLKGYHFKLAS